MDMAYEKKYEKKYGKIIYNATIDISSSKYIEKKNFRRRYVKVTTTIAVIVFMFFIPLWVEGFSFPITHPGNLMIILGSVLYLTLIGFAIYTNIHSDPRTKVYLTEKGIFYGLEPYWEHYFVRYNDILHYRIGVTPVGCECLEIIMKPKRWNVRRRYILLTDDIRDLQEFMKKLGKMVSREIENDEDDPYFMMPYER